MSDSRKSPVVTQAIWSTSSSGSVSWLLNAVKAIQQLVVFLDLADFLYYTVHQGRVCQTTRNIAIYINRLLTFLVINTVKCTSLVVVFQGAKV